MFSRKILMMFFSFGLFFFSVSLRAENSMMEIVNGVKELCGGKGHGSEIAIVAKADASTSKAVSLIDLLRP